MELSERLLSFLGKAENDPDFQAFVAEFKPYMKVYAGEHHKSYGFRKLGFTLLYESSVTCCFSLAFHIQTRAVRDGDYKSYSELLPWNVPTNDTRKQVSQKLDTEPYSATPYEHYPDWQPSRCAERRTWWDKYCIDPYQVNVMFDSPADDMSLFGVSYLSPFEKLRDVQAVQPGDDNKSGPRPKARRRSVRKPRR